jgi:putative oxidoreductase
MDQSQLRVTLARLEEPAYAAMRVVAGALFSVHGMQKIFGVLGAAFQPPFASQLWIGGVIELLGGLMIAAGLGTRFAAFLASGTMAVAYLQFHWKLQFANYQWLPHANQGELAALFCFVFFYVMAKGPGAFSLDAWLAREPVRSEAARAKQVFAKDPAPRDVERG